MTLEQLMARYFRLRQELSVAYGQRPWQCARIDRLARELAVAEQQISALQAMEDIPADRIPVGGLRVVRGATL